MPHASPFQVHVGDLLRHGGPAKRHHIAEPVEWTIDMSRVVPDPPLDAELELFAISGGIVVRGTVTITTRHTCARCLTESDRVMSVAVDQVAERTGGDDGYELHGENLDLEPILRDEVMLAMPLLPVCEQGCSGLVPGAETSLNVGTPEPEGRSESPFSVLEGLFEPGD